MADNHGGVFLGSAWRGLGTAWASGSMYSAHFGADDEADVVSHICAGTMFQKASHAAGGRMPMYSAALSRVTGVFPHLYYYFI